ncbi:MAG: carboxypeptidase regulatory-like domain-containing protein [Calditrichota bacterium]
MFARLVILSLAVMIIGMPCTAEPLDPVTGAAMLNNAGPLRDAGNFIPSPPYRDNADELVGERITVGHTFYEYQSNGTISKQIALDENGDIHIIWMWGPQPEGVVFPQRHVYYNYVLEGEPQFDDGTAVDELNMAGYCNLGYSPDVGPVPIFHASRIIDGVTFFDEHNALDEELGAGNFTVFTNPRLNDLNFVWPHGTVDRNGRTHILARFYPAPAGVINDPVDLNYTRGRLNDDNEWEYSDPVSAGLSKVLAYTAAASRASDRVALVYLHPVYPQGEWGNWQGAGGAPAANSNVMVAESENGEDFNFGEPFNVTRMLRPNPQAAQDSPFYLGDTLRPYLYLDACYDDNDNLHVVFSTVGLVENPQAIGALRYNERGNFLWHWDRESDQTSLIAEGWYGGDGLPGSWRSNLSFVSIGAAENGNLYTIWTMYPGQGDLAVSGRICGEIYATVSVDGGASWAQAINITNTHTPNAQAGDCQSETWCTLAEVVDDNLHISYVLDLDAGGLVQGEGQATNSPVMYHVVPTAEVPTEPRLLGRDFHAGLPPAIAVDADLPVLPGVPEEAPGEATFVVQNPNQNGQGLHVALSVSEELQGSVFFDPAAFRVAPGGEQEVTVIFAPAEVGEYNGTILLAHNGTNAQSPIEIDFQGIGVGGFGELHGVVSDLSNNQPVANATINLMPGGYQTASDNQGNYQFERIPAYNYRLSCQAPNFLTFNSEVEVGVDAQAQFGIELRFSTFEISVQQVNVPVPTGEAFDTHFFAQNRGNGAVDFTSEVVLPGGANVEPWDLRQSYAISQITGDPRIAGTAFFNGRFYVAGHAGGAHLIYVLDRDGNIVDRINQLGQSQYGMQDLAWDGQWLWGSGERRIFGFTPDGQQQVVFDGLFNPMVNVAWDSDRNILWASGNTTDIIGYTREGQQAARLNRRNLRQYGLAYYPNDPDNHPLYIFHSPTGNMMVLTKMNPDNNDTMSVRILGGVGRAAGLEITNGYDPYSWVLIAAANADADDRIDIWQLESRRDWVNLDPLEGQIAANNRQNFTLTLDATSVPADMQMEATLHFVHNGRGAAVDLPVTMEVTEEGGFTRRNMEFTQGWNMVSLNVEPENDSVRVICRPLTDAGILEMVKDGVGRFYRPEFNFINIPRWNPPEGYQFKLTRPAQLEVTGTTVAAQHPIQLQQGWQIVAYYPRAALEVRVALSGIRQQLRMVKDYMGRFYLPEFDFSNMAPLTEGQGYQMNLLQAVELVYQLGDNLAAPIPEPLAHFPVLPAGESNMSVLLLEVPNDISEIAAISSAGQIVGSGVVNERGQIGLAVWGSLENNAPGLKSNETFTLLGWNGESEVSLDADWTEGLSEGRRDARPTMFQTDGLAIGAVKAASLPLAFAFYGAYPNPFNSRAELRFDLPERAKVFLELFDASGRLVSRLAAGDFPAGRHSLSIDGKDMPSGIYFSRIEAGRFSGMQKMILMR